MSVCLIRNSKHVQLVDRGTICYRPLRQTEKQDIKIEKYVNSFIQ